MEQRGPMLQWKLSLAETLAFTSTVAALVFIAMTKFQTKDDAAVSERRIERLENEISAVKVGVAQVAVDVSFIRGVITVQTPKSKGN